MAEKACGVQRVDRMVEVNGANYVTSERAGTVFALTLAMCAISGLLAVRKVRRLDPAEVF